MKKLLFTTVLAMLLTACGKSLDGTYVDGSGMMEYKFESNGKVYAGAMGMETELEYEIDGEKLKIYAPDGENQILTLNEDGTIGGPMGITLKKKES